MVQVSTQKLPRHLYYAIEYGIIHPDWVFEDYLIHAVDNNGYETVCIHGTQGSGKSNRMLQMGAWVHDHVLEEELGEPPTQEEVWDEVLKSIVFKPSDFVIRLEEVQGDRRLPIVLWDDIGVHYTSSTFKTDIDQYSAIDSTWAAIRTKVAIVIVTIPIISRLAKNVKDNLTFEVFLGRNQMEQIRRLFYLPGTRNIDSNLFKPVLETPSRFDLYKIPPGIWRKYWSMRLKLTDEALATLKGVTDMENMEDWTSVWEIAKELSVSANTLQQMGSRGLIPTQRMNGVLCVPNYFIPELKSEYPIE